MKNLGVFFGNYSPEIATFEEILPSLKKRLAYWKQFKISKIGKARVVEMFLASKLVFAMKFYPIPANIIKELQQIIFEYVNYPQKVITVAQKEMWKVKALGGIKLVNVQIKSETSKAKWMIDLVTNPNLELNFKVFTTLIGNQKGNISGRDLVFVEKSYIQYQLKTESAFYKEALLAMTKFEKRKGIDKIEQWDKEHLFYNPLFSGKNGNILTLTKYCERNKVYTLEPLLEEKAKESRKLSFDSTLTNMLGNLILKTNVRKYDLLVTHRGEEVKLTQITQKQLYEEALITLYGDHHSQLKCMGK